MAGEMTPEEALCGPNITPGEAKDNGNRRRLRRLAITGVAYKRLLNLNLELGRISAFYEESQYHPEQQTIKVKLFFSHLRVSGESFLDPRH